MNEPILPSQKTQKNQSQSYRQKMSDVHTWFGVLAGVLLFVVFIMGSVSFFKDEISVWTQPDVPYQQVSDDVENIAHTVTSLQTHYPTAESWYIYPATDRNPLTQSYVKSGKERFGKLKFFDKNHNEIKTMRDTRGGEFFYRMHFDLHYMSPMTARWIVGFFSMMMLIALITGVIVHKKIFSDLFTFRPNKGQRSWLDIHNVFSVLPLPFHLMITFTGIISLVAMYMPYGERFAKLDRQTVYERIYSFRPVKPNDVKSAKPATMMPVGELVKKTKQDLQTINPHYHITSVSVNLPNTDKSRVIIDGKMDNQITLLSTFYIYDGVTGKLLEKHTPNLSGVKANRLLIGLHEGKYANLYLRWLHFLSGFMGTAMVGSGLILWLVKRKQKLASKQFHLGFWLTERLTISTVAGVPLAMLGFLWLNRLLPLDLAKRADWEMHGFFIIWLLVFLLTLLSKPSNPSKIWRVLLLISAIAFAITPILNAITTQKGFLNSVAQQDWLFVSFDVFFVVCAVLYAVAYYKYQPYQAKNKQVVK